MRRSIFSAALVLLVSSVVLVLSAPRTAQAQSGAQKWALVVGVDHYDTSQIAPLQFAGADARAVAQALRDAAGFPADHIALMTSEGAENERPTSTNILTRLSNLKDVITPGDTFVFFFSGHGAVQDGESYLLTSDTSLVSPTLLRRSALGIKDVQAAMREIPAARILQMVDACRNNPHAGRGGGDNLMTEGFSRDLAMVPRRTGAVDAAVTLYACKEGQRSYEGFQSHGYFSWFVVQGLRGSAADAEGNVTLPSLVNYLEKSVPQAVRVHTGRVQEPWASIDGTGALSWVLVPRRVSASPTATLPALVSLPAVPAVPPPTVRLSFPPPGYATAQAHVVLGALIVGGGRLSEVTVSVNGQDVVLAAGGVHKTAQGAVVKAAVPLEMGDNTILVTTVAESGQPAQAAVVVRRTPGAAVTESAPIPAPVAPVASTPSPAAAPPVALAPAASAAGPRRMQIAKRGSICSTWIFTASDRDEIVACGIPRSSLPEVERLSNEAAWPSGITTLTGRDQWESNFSNYEAYEVARFRKNLVLLRIPADGNQGMPEPMRPRRDFYVPILEDGVRPR